jgi:hypothetical protein
VTRARRVRTPRARAAGGVGAERGALQSAVARGPAGGAAIAAEFLACLRAEPRLTAGWLAGCAWHRPAKRWQATPYPRLYLGLAWLPAGCAAVAQLCHAMATAQCTAVLCCGMAGQWSVAVCSSCMLRDGVALGRGRSTAVLYVVLALHLAHHACLS